MLDFAAAQANEAGTVPGPDENKEQDTAFPVRINRIKREAEDILSFEFVKPDGGALPRFTAGAHIHVHLDDSLSRQYSLCNDPAETHRYVVAVLREEEGRGGSKAMHETLKEGQEIYISGPDNQFELAERAVDFHLLLAGGIGVTPMMAMIEELERRGARYLMHYCTRSPEKTAFLERLRPRIEQGTVILHHDGGDPANGLDIAATLAEHKIGTHLYACGPPGFMNAVNTSVGAWPPHNVHQEYFTAREMTEAEKAWDARAFKVKVASTGAVLDVPAGRSIVEVLREYGISIQTDCEEGYCGTCITHYVEGEPVHRDTVLAGDDREDYLMVCCARAKSEILVLDL
jgi:vanillate O-demethylase ferredoxin subunit